MKIYITLVTLLFSLQLNAQLEEKEQLKRVSYGLEFNGDLNYRWINKVPSEIELLELKNENDRFGMGYRLGFNFEYRMRNHFSLKTGILYSDRSYRTKVKSLDWADKTLDNLPDASYLSYHFNYIDIPLKLSYEFAHYSRLRFYASAGVSTSLFFSNVQKKHVQTGNNWNTTKDSQFLFGYDVINFFGELDLGIDYQLSDQFKLRFNLNLQHSIKGLNSNLLSKTYLQSSGLGIGLLFTPKK